MTDRTCGTCAWWRKNRDGYQTELSKGKGRTAVSCCEYDNHFRLTDAEQCCRHHATTRGWGEEKPKPVNDNDTSPRDERDVACFEAGVKSAGAEIAHLKARCQNARDFVDFVKQFAGTTTEITQEYGWRARAWLEADDA